GRHQGDAKDLLRVPSDPAREPVVAVDQVVAPLRSLTAKDAAQELRQVPGELLLGNGRAWPRFHLQDSRAVRQRRDLGPALPMTPRVHIESDPAGSQVL